MPRLLRIGFKELKENAQKMISQKNVIPGNLTFFYKIAQSRGRILTAEIRLGESWIFEN